MRNIPSQSAVQFSRVADAVSGATNPHDFALEIVAVVADDIWTHALLHYANLSCEIRHVTILGDRYFLHRQNAMCLFVLRLPNLAKLTIRMLAKDGAKRCCKEPFTESLNEVELDIGIKFSK